MWPTWLIVLLTVLVISILNMIIGFTVFAFIYNRKKKNNIDIFILDYNKKKGLTIRKRIGRFFNDPHKGRSLVTAGAMANSVKENLGQKVGDDDILASGEFKRRFVIVAQKDGVFTPFQFNAEDGSFSLSPIKYEAIRFVLDTQQDAQDLYNDADKRTARAIMWTAVTILVIVVIAIIVLLSIMVAQGPEFATKLATRGVKGAVALPELPNLPG